MAKHSKELLMKRNHPKFILLLGLALLLLCLPSWALAAGEEKQDQPSLQELMEYIEELESRLDKLEKDSASDRVFWSGELRVTQHSTTYDSPTRGQEGVISEYKLMRFRLNMRTELTDKTRFTGRLGSNKVWGHVNQNASESPLGYEAPSNSNLRVERAYVDYFINSTYSFSFGRLPASEGPPTEMREDSPRKSTYPTGLYELELDGLVASANLPKVDGFTPAIRTIYGEFSVPEDTGFYQETPVDPIKIYLLQFESGFEKAGLEGLLILDVFRIPRLSEAPGGLEDYITALTGEQVSQVDYPRYNGSMDRQLVYLGLERIGLTGLDFYAMAVSSRIQGNGDAAVYHLASSGRKFCAGYFIETDCSNLGEKVSKTGHAYEVGLGYKIPWDSHKQPKIGIEYHQADKNYVGTAFYSDYGNSELNFANVVGTATHIYYLQPLERSLFLRVGQNQVHRKWHMFTDLDDDQKLTDLYLMLNARF